MSDPNPNDPQQPRPEKPQPTQEITTETQTVVGTHTTGDDREVPSKDDEQDS